MNRAEWAKSLLDSDNFKEVFNELRDVEINNIVNSNQDDIGKRENAYRMISAYNQIFAAIESMAADIKIVEKRWKIF
jgi:type IV secretory pathway VirD2 relaxase